MNSSLRKQDGITLVEVLVVVGILGILGVVTGLFLLKYIPEYNLRSAANTLSQDLRTTQMHALKRLRPWAVDFNTGAHTYSIRDSGPDENLDSGDDIIVKSVNLISYDSAIRFGSGTGSRVRYNEEGTTSGTVVIRLTNSAGAVSTTTVIRTGAIRVTR